MKHIGLLLVLEFKAMYVYLKLMNVTELINVYLITSFNEITSQLTYVFISGQFEYAIFWSLNVYLIKDF